MNLSTTWRLIMKFAHKTELGRYPPIASTLFQHLTCASIFMCFAFPKSLDSKGVIDLSRAATRPFATERKEGMPNIIGLWKQKKRCLLLRYPLELSQVKLDKEEEKCLTRSYAFRDVTFSS